VPQINPSIPILLQPDASEDPKIQTALSQLVATINALDTANLSPSAGIVDGQFASPTSAVWRTVSETDVLLNASFVALTTGVYWCPRQENSGIQLSGAGATSSAEGLWVPPVAGDVAVAGKTTRLRLRVGYVTNATAPGVAITWGLYPVTTGGATPNIAYTLGTVISGSTAVATAPGGSGAGEAKSAGFDLSALAAGAGYIIGFTGSGTQNASSVVHSRVYLEMRHT
jgi:hypothetical protein